MKYLLLLALVALPKMLPAPINENLTITEPLDIVMLTDVQDYRTVLRETALKDRYTVAAIRYDWLFEGVHRKTGINKAVLFSYFFVEAVNAKGETDLFARYGNPGGIKGTTGKVVRRYDDCGGAPCRFAVLDRNQIVDGWAKVFNRPRYDRCRGMDIPTTCLNLQRAGYHTSDTHRMRAKIALKYFSK